ncbi:MAG: CsgG/HfaB family protein [Caldimicrobium sp.]|nr:CsgG/HfaB family protein [Caldimicrobium sp.]MCX7872961.1 CsgG/HfaB family protein [Caldimicrobium sp.]MDW8094579.1 hypothetical protein [Caldimicrobium sp.]
MKKLIIFLILAFHCVLGNSMAQPSKKVLILPFEIYAPQDLSYLKRAIPEMLTSRLFVPDRISVIELEKVERELKQYPLIEKKTAQEIGAKVKADFVIWGSISVLGDVVSIDAQILELTGNKKPAQFFQEVRGLSEIIPQITRFSRKARLYIEGKEEDFYREDLSLAYGVQGFVPGRAHPERGFFGYVPYPTRPIREEPPVERAKPRFGEHGDPAYEGLTKDIVIDLSGPQPRIGIAREKAPAVVNATQPSPYLYYYPPQPYYQYSPPPYYYYKAPPAEEGMLSKIKRALWPFGKDERRLGQPLYPQQITPQPLYPQPLPVPPQNVPAPPQSVIQQNLPQANIPSPIPQNQSEIPVTQTQPAPPSPPQQPPTQVPSMTASPPVSAYPPPPVPQGQTQGQRGQTPSVKDHPWRWQ